MKTTRSTPMGVSYREDILAFAREAYQTEPEYLWMKAPHYAVLRHADNRKWYALIMDVPRERLGLPGDGAVDILNIKCDPLIIGSLCLNEGFLPAYHMHRESWLSVLLDGTVEKKQILPLLEMSFDLTHTRPAPKACARTPKTPPQGENDHV